MLTPFPAIPAISPLNPTLQPGQVRVFEALALEEVEWTLKHGPNDTPLELEMTPEGLALRVPETVKPTGVYFLRATSRRDPRRTVVTTLHILPSPKPLAGFARCS